MFPKGEPQILVSCHLKPKRPVMDSEPWLCGTSIHWVASVGLWSPRKPHLLSMVACLLFNTLLGQLLGALYQTSVAWGADGLALAAS